MQLMPYRQTPLVSEEIYHVYNRSVARQPIFLTNTYYQRAYEVMSYYTNLNPPIRFSHFSRLPSSIKNDLHEKINKENKKLVKILAFSLMPNHVHFLIKEITEKGISNFMRKFQNSYAKYFNTKEGRSGSLFQSMFKAVRIENGEQLIHITRYIHLNPVTSYILRNIKQLGNYPWTSFPIYISKNNSNVVDKEMILSMFPSVAKFINFTKDQISYQRELNKIKHLALE